MASAGHRDAAEAVRPLRPQALVPLVVDLGRSVQVDVTLDAGLLDAVDQAARTRGLTRSDFLVSALREKIAG